MFKVASYTFTVCVLACMYGCVFMPVEDYLHYKFYMQLASYFRNLNFSNYPSGFRLLKLSRVDTLESAAGKATMPFPGGKDLKLLEDVFCHFCSVCQR